MGCGGWAPFNPTTHTKKNKTLETDMPYSQQEKIQRQKRIEGALLLIGFFGLIGSCLVAISTGNWQWLFPALGALALFIHSARRYCA